jgi:hypothetical protein
MCQQPKTGELMKTSPGPNTEFSFDHETTFTYSLALLDGRDELLFHSLPKSCGARGGVVVKALRYKLAGRRFDYRWCHGKFSVT